MAERADRLDALLGEGRPNSNGLVCRAANDVLSFVFQREVGVEDLLLVADELAHDFAIDGVHEPDYVVFASRDQHRCLLVPLDEIEILLGDIIELLLQGESILDVPDA